MNPLVPSSFLVSDEPLDQEPSSVSDAPPTVGADAVAISLFKSTE